MDGWKLDEWLNTSAGSVAAGRTGKGPALVLVHGWPWSSYAWRRIIPRLARNYCVYWYDMPGYGRSEKSQDQRTSIDVQSDVFGEMIEHWRLKAPIVIAHDIGGATALRAHLLDHVDFDRCVLINVVAMRPWGSEFFAHVSRNVDVFRKLPPHIHQGLVQAYIKGAIVHPLGRGDIGKLVEPWLSDEGRGSFYRQFAQADERYTAELEPLYREVRCPVKILWGGDDPWIPLNRGQSLHALMPQSSFEILPGVGHLPQLEAPARLMPILRRFLERSARCPRTSG